MNQSIIGISSFPKYFEPYIRFLRAKLSPVRFKHCVDVGLAMGKAFNVYGNNPPFDPHGRDDWMLSGLVHDVMKEASVQTMRWWIEKYSPDELSLIPPSMQDHHVYMHGPAGSVFVRHALGIRRSGTFHEAIAHHVGCYEAMSLLARCLNVADMTQPAERYRGCDKLGRIFFGGDLNSAELLLSAWTKEFFEQIRFPVHPAFEPKIAKMTKLLKPAPEFFSREG
ncbi:MAG: hypothetical protein PHC70_04055 [Patescibacteria group bacterium]|nr:hypothetical protein [Patescibacteria group bacterium]